MGRDPLSEKAYKRVYEKVKKAGGDAAHEGKQREREGKGLHELIDPSSYGVIRRSISWLDPQKDETFVLLRGTAMLEETRLDTTGSMGNNVDIAMEVLPRTYKLLAKGPRAVLGKYDVQMITAIFGDVGDKYILCRSQAEMDERIAEQMTLMVPEGEGGDWPEDPQYGLFGAAYLTSATIKQLGLKSYDFTITDAPGRNHVSLKNLIRVFGPEVMEKVKENGFSLDPANLPSTKEIMIDLLKTTHAFVLIVKRKGYEEAITAWNTIYGRDRVVVIPDINFLPEVKAAIIGLTEGVLELDTLEEYLINEAKMPRDSAQQIKRAVAGIPIGAQAMLENFDKIPLKGDIFANKGDLWPIQKGENAPSNPDKVWK